MNILLVTKVTIYSVNHYEITSSAKLGKCHKHHETWKSNEVFLLINSLIWLNETSLGTSVGLMLFDGLAFRDGMGRMGSLGHGTWVLGTASGQKTGAW